MVVKVGVLTLFKNDTVAALAVLLSTMLVPVVTAPVKVAPPEWVRVKVASGVVAPIAPLTVTIPPVPALMLKDSVLLVVPLMLLLNCMVRPAALPVVLSNAMLALNTTGPV